MEPVLGFCSDYQYKEFLLQVPAFEHMMYEDGVIIIKFWLSITKDEQLKRFEGRKDVKRTPTETSMALFFDWKVARVLMVVGLSSPLSKSGVSVYSAGFGNLLDIPYTSYQSRDFSFLDSRF